MVIKEYILQNWALILTLSAFAISLKVTVFLDKKSINRLYTLIAAVFLLSIVVFAEFRMGEHGGNPAVRAVLTAARYSATPFIIALVIFTLIKRQRWFVFIPAAALAVLNFVSVRTGTVFSVKEDCTLVRGTLWLLPYVFVGVYYMFLIYVLCTRSNRQATEIIPIVYLSFALVAGLLLPFVLGSAFSQIFCTTIAMALFVYYVFSIIQITKKDPLTGLLNRQAYYADLGSEPEEITALLSIDMNGLKTINDSEGHAAGDEALVTLALCFIRALKRRQSCYRVGGDEFVIICRNTSHNEVIKLDERIRRYVGETEYSCSVGYCYCGDGSMTPDEMIKESDAKMYAEKARHYAGTGSDRRQKNGAEETALQADVKNGGEQAE
ncbi:MAG: GGDEF domain-containing protein [Clostridia bacterium]|nr:GGDEF domain-containing protein [Clostridia bacterium]